MLLDESEARRRVIFTTRFEANVGRRTSTLRLYTTPYYCTTYWTLNVVGVFIGVRDTRSPGRTRHRSYRTTPIAFFLMRLYIEKDGWNGTGAWQVALARLPTVGERPSQSLISAPRAAPGVLSQQYASVDAQHGRRACPGDRACRCSLMARSTASLQPLQVKQSPFGCSRKR